MKNKTNQSMMEKLMAKFAPVASAGKKTRLPGGKSCDARNYPMDSDKQFAKRLATRRLELARQEAAAASPAPQESAAETNAV